ncbi:CocE/NonD family hydrolase [Burkholderia gladioli]|uniref:CocE/NonD family hydrolase n=1 Tax=Burkholderia glumae TaxID=337 RepID=A0ABY5BBM1_BURGL|nr:CocE/NonD family hydrolase [Burkholderia glumae]MCM2496015.1 CocE/NonD family hydrolase [Burkholderia glumae]MCM2541816.1 CocE/NonD family hydrolase [Burkholderia glumae]MCM2546258.1 CocE/NonD family hydrolase [Burkholderia glumae]MCQ0034255.1 CocE/NonD family hydrolase [Burkholderia glumae]MCQ0038542.1 CocE/NonD family hydrolase [Burkholderia glumae]
MATPDNALVFTPSVDPQTAGAPVLKHSVGIDGSMVIERDVAVTLRDGTKIYVDVFRPEGTAKVPPLIAWSPYGKHAPIQYDKYFTRAGVAKGQVSSYTAFEAPDPVYWCPKGFAVINVDPRGAWNSEGRMTYFNSDEADDYFDLIEWAGTQSWSNGKVGLAGVSYLAVSQWHVAAKRPPHLAAINPWEGWTDPYREIAFHGGIPDSWFYGFVQSVAQFGLSEHEDLVKMAAEHPLFDDYWKGKIAALEKIDVPAYVVASWSDHGLHTRGTLEGFRRISSKHKWLEIHGRKKWGYYYEPSSLERQEQFYTEFLKGQDAGLSEWPKVRLELRDAFYSGEFVAGQSWPLENTELKRLYLDAASSSLRTEPVQKTATASYTAGTNTLQPATFDFRFEEDTSIVGGIGLHMYLSADDATDADVFVAVQKLDKEGNVVPFAYCAQFDDGPVALGWLRASHRAIDAEQSLPNRPFHPHVDVQPLEIGKPTKLDIEVWPSGTSFKKGEGLRLLIQDRDVNRYPLPNVTNRHEWTVNSGRYLIHTGGDYNSHLVIPVFVSP